ncbi:hypothetical protein CLV71_103165 [Actinophytocola oryzae]|uniref:Uncharacterized protein n=1 Tax=Actinophytocola oryzae TaxID=502181 RepID=A0A4R7VXY7_9PSEU|nr:hypothetical protein CLV71_103165 [Actinophytocola oryzae]
MIAGYVPASDRESDLATQSGLGPTAHTGWAYLWRRVLIPGVLPSSKTRYTKGCQERRAITP